MRITLALLTLCLFGGNAAASTFDIGSATDLFTPTFRGAANTTYLGWDVFGAPGTTVINDTTPDIGTDAGSFVTTDGTDHQSGSFNYYSYGGPVAEDVTFSTAGVNGSGYTTVIVQALTLFGDWGPSIDFGAIGGVDPSLVLLETNAAGAGQLFAKYELPGTADPETFSMSSDVGHTSMGVFVVDTVWSPNGYAPDTAIATPEPTAALLSILGLAGLPLWRRR